MQNKKSVLDTITDLTSGISNIDLQPHRGPYGIDPQMIPSQDPLATSMHGGHNLSWTDEMELLEQYTDSSKDMFSIQQQLDQVQPIQQNIQNQQLGEVPQTLIQQQEPYQMQVHQTSPTRMQMQVHQSSTQQFHMQVHQSQYIFVDIWDKAGFQL